MLTKDTIEVIERAMGLHSRLVTVQLKLHAVPALFRDKFNSSDKDKPE